MYRLCVYAFTINETFIEDFAKIKKLCQNRLDLIDQSEDNVPLIYDPLLISKYTTADFK